MNSSSRLSSPMSSCRVAHEPPAWLHCHPVRMGSCDGRNENRWVHPPICNNNGPSEECGVLLTFDSTQGLKSTRLMARRATVWRNSDALRARAGSEAIFPNSVCRGVVVRIADRNARRPPRSLRGGHRAAGSRIRRTAGSSPLYYATEYAGSIAWRW